MERVRFITHKGATILKVDLSHSETIEANLEVLARAREVIATKPPHSLLLLTDVTKAFFNAKGVAAIKEWSTFNTPYVKASAVLGIVGIYRVVYEVVVKLTGREIVAFTTEAEALDWLASK